MIPGTILVVDDEKQQRETLGGILFGKEPDGEFSGQGGPVLGGAKK